jgi:phytoene/squalene synthetase
LDRVYLPEAWLAEAGTDAAALRAPAASTALRSVLDRCLDGIDGLLPDALALPMQLQDRRLAMEAGAIAELARVLAARLRRQDPVARRVELSKPAKLWIGLRGALAARGASARRRATAGAAA